ncbi:MAG TPA: carbamoyltransferase HypF [Candidatus Eremiobacteraeota bacterium]|nr:MAG: Carbamoyltransferase HypF [bacterium ADurb.Bin363]HPZ08337.1 carbamoyltransferase HypF [Candidatus Eremiobacteraeota bacterium]
MLSSATIKVQGIVQGVGFRPFIHKLAGDSKLSGYILNCPEGVLIEVEGEKENIESFYKDISLKEPPAARIIHSAIYYQTLKGFNEFTIKKSQRDGKNSIFISPDLAICSDCRRELSDPEDRRYNYPFINCTNCGPRYTIIKDIPYDRPFTTMKDFIMCPLCKKEYEDIEDRRYHAQPDCCSSCGPALSWYEGDLKETEGSLEKACEAIKGGKIIALKGLGGFHLVCDATRDEAVLLLRQRKHRPHKPFAVMFPDIDILANYVHITEEAIELLRGSISPIVMLKKKDRTDLSKEVAPGLSDIGSMIPYTPLHEILFKAGNFKALIMTSGNLQDEPIQIKNDECRETLKSIADGFLFHNRDIARRCDDSVVKILNKNFQIIRRARGYTPLPVRCEMTSPITILGCGAEFKNTFCIYKDDFAFLSPHIGDLHNFETLSYYEETIEHYCSLYDISPSVIAYDLHPSYLSTDYALKRKAKIKIPVQHHHAHFASCLAEHSIKDRSIGVIFDGTGYGTDGKIWGGEFFIGDSKEVERAGYIKYYPMPGGDMAAVEGYRMALSYLYAVFKEEIWSLPWIEGQEEKKIRNIINLIKSNINCPETSSMGRLFDGMSALLDICHVASYEGQAAMELENMVAEWVDTCYPFLLEEEIINIDPLIYEVVTDIKKGIHKSIIAAKFHNTISMIVRDKCQKIRKLDNLNTVILSGGVFQNFCLSCKIQKILQEKGFNVYQNLKIPTNDGGISLGQVAVAYSQIGEDFNV